MDSLQWIQHFHLIRPYWLLAIFPLALIVWLAARAQMQSRSWASVIDKRLLAHLLEGVNERKKTPPIKRLFVLGCIVIFALAGPAFEKRPQPVFKTQSALVILLDLSRSMDATDIKPSRLSRAHFKINDILSQRKEGQTALIAYAANAYVVSPLTDDAQTIASQVSALETTIMPAQGSRLDIALNKAQQLFNNAGQSKGDILVITDSVTAQDKETINTLSSQNFKTSILAIGTKAGAPIANHNGGFVKDRNGSIVIPKLDINQLKSAALAGAGKFSLITANDRDINYLLPSISSAKDPSAEDQTDAKGNKFKTDIWHEEGPWLLLLVIPFAAYAFRKGLIFALLIFILPLPQPVQAEISPAEVSRAELSQAEASPVENSWGWSDLWSTQNQQGAKVLQQGDAKQAAELFNDPQWKATAKYQSGEYEKAAELLNNIDTANANYNRGNALAKANDLENAIKAYERALQLDPNHEDAKYNKQLLEQAKQQQDKKSQDDKQDGNKDPNDKNKDNKDQSDQNQQSKDGQKGDSESEQQNSQNADNNQNNESEQQSQSQDAEQDQEESQAQQAKEDADAETDVDKKAQKSAEAKESAEDRPSAEEIAAEQKRLSETTPDLEQQQAQQWLKKIPDDPGGLLRRKFKYQYSREKNQDEQQPW